jgi:mevalonate kinase
MMTIAFFVRFLLLPTWDSLSSSSVVSKHLEITIQSQGLPIGAGLGSSAAFSVAASAACFQLLYQWSQYFTTTTTAATTTTTIFQFPNSIMNNNNIESTTILTQCLPHINHWAYSGEILMHGTPSGLDNTTSCYGGLVSYRKDPEQGILFQSLSHPPALRMFLVHTKVPRSTKQLVSAVNTLFHTYPTIIRPIFDSISHITDRVVESVEEVYNGQLTRNAFLTVVVREKKE